MARSEESITVVHVLGCALGRWDYDCLECPPACCSYCAGLLYGSKVNFEVDEPNGGSDYTKSRAMYTKEHECGRSCLFGGSQKGSRSVRAPPDETLGGGVFTALSTSKLSATVLEYPVYL